MDASETVLAGRSEFEHHHWERAYELLTEADREAPLEPADLERLAQAARWSRHHATVLDAFERAEARYAAAGDHRGAARVALQLTRDLFERGNDSVASGWFGHARTLLGDDTACAEYAHLQFVTGYILFTTGHLEEAREELTAAVEGARETGDRDVEGMARIYLGHVLVILGAEAEGLAMVDEATAAAMGGSLGIQAAGSVYCSTIFLCRNRGDWRRASEWTDVSLRWCQRESVAGFPGLCRFHRAEVMRIRGALADAERDALDAVEELLDSAPRFAGWAFHELGEIRRRRGNMAGADEAFRRASELGLDPQPGQALLWLDQGDVVKARAAIRRARADETGLAQESQGHVLPAAVTIELAAGDVAAARDALAELEERAARSRSTAFLAAALGARGEIGLAEARPDEAIADLRTAWRRWCEVDAPYEAASTLVLLARALTAAGSEADAELELEAARTAFERLGAQHQVRSVAALRTQPADGVRQVRTFLFTDIVDSTRFVELLGDEAWEDLLRWHDRTLRAAFSTHGGEEIKHGGDGFFVAFPDADAAIACARTVQRALQEHRRDHGFAPRVRVGIHTAEATERDGDYFGKGVHASARVAAAAGAGEILASAAALDASQANVPTSDRRTLQLKGLAGSVEVATVEW